VQIVMSGKFLPHKDYENRAFRVQGGVMKAPRRQKADGAIAILAWP
jgi:hypothetical protein